MTYAIGYVIYGIDLTTEPRYRKNREKSWLDDLTPDLKMGMEDGPESIGIEHAYSGNGDPPMWLGVTLAEFDECNSFRLEDIAKFAVPTEEMKKEWAAKVASLDPDLHRILLQHFGENPENPDASGGLTLQPDVLVLWGSS